MDKLDGLHGCVWWERPRRIEDLWWLVFCMTVLPGCSGRNVLAITLRFPRPPSAGKPMSYVKQPIFTQKGHHYGEHWEGGMWSVKLRTARPWMDPHENISIFIEKGDKGEFKGINVNICKLDKINKSFGTTSDLVNLFSTFKFEFEQFCFQNRLSRGGSNHCVTSHRTFQFPRVGDCLLWGRRVELHQRLCCTEATGSSCQVFGKKITLATED